MEPCARGSNNFQDMPKCKCLSLKENNVKLQKDLNEARKENNALRGIVYKNELECSKIHKLKKLVEVLFFGVKNARSPLKRSASLESIPQKRSTSLDSTRVSENLDVAQVVYESLSKNKSINEINEKYTNIKQREILAKDELILSLEMRVKDLNSQCETLMIKLKQNEETLKIFKG